MSHHLGHCKSSIEELTVKNKQTNKGVERDSAESLNLCSIDSIDMGWIIFCCRGLSWALFSSRCQ